MSATQLTDQDLLYVEGRGDSRTLILKELSNRPDNYVKLRDLAKSINKSAGTVNFHCKGLDKRGLIKTEMAVGQTNVKITEKGMLAITELTKKQGADNAQASKKN